MFSHIISRRGEIELRNWKEDEIDDDSGLSIIVPDEKTRISQIRSGSCSFDRRPKTTGETDASMSGVTRIKVKCPFTRQRKSFTSSADGIL